LLRCNKCRILAQANRKDDTMSDNKNPAWKTKYGPRRVRHEAPTLDEAIEAARGMSDDLQAQAEIASSLMGVAPEQVLAELTKLAAAQKAAERKNIHSVAFSNRDGVERAVVVERKPRRMALSASDRTAFVRNLSARR
jgi:hypothetical protein